MTNALHANSYFETGDWLIIGFYLVGIILFGVWFGKGQNSTRDYFLGSKNVPWWGVGLSIVATETSALTFIGVPALAYGTDLGFIQVVIGYVIARVLLAIVLVPHFFRGEIYSPYQLFANAFGAPARQTAAAFFLIAGTLAAGVRVYVTSIPLTLMLGADRWAPGGQGIVLAILLFVGLSLIYTYVGGIKAVVWTDAVQFFLFMAGGVFTLLYIPQLFDGGFPEVFSLAAKGGKLAWLNLHFSLAPPYNLWMGLIGGTVHVLSSHGVDQLLVQRVLTCKSVADGRKALVLSAVIIFPLFVVFLLTGAMLWVYYQKFPFAIPIPETAAGVTKNDYVYPIFILTAVPPLLRGFLIVAILSAAMSSVSSALSALASVSTMDLLRGQRWAQGGERAFLKLSKVSTLFWAAALIGVACASREVPFVFNAAFALTGLTSGAMLGGLVAALYFRQGSALPVICGMVTSLGAMIVIQLKTHVAWPWYTLIGATITVLVARALRGAASGPQAALESRG